jgi:uncharacterized coiled-coil protein SlyX
VADQPGGPMAPTGRPAVDLNVIQYQVGALQSAIDRGIGGLERTIDKGFEGVATRLDKFEARLKTIEERQAFDAARLKALEEFRAEVDRREDRRRQQADAEMRAAVDNSQMWKTGRWIAGAILFLFTLAGVIVGIVNALG